MKYMHYVFTRFNIKTNYGCELKDPENPPMLKILDESYLKSRFQLFERFTLPSMKNQTNQNFKWVILFHKKTPKQFLDKIKKLKKEYYFEDLYFDDDELFKFSDYCKKYGENCKYYITTRIDNDDMIDENYIKEIQKYVDIQFKECIISFPHGEKFDLNSNKKYDSRIQGNHFISLVSSDKITVLDFIHSYMWDLGKEIVLLETDKPMWTEIIHDSNVTNKIDENDILNYKNKVLKNQGNMTVERNKKDVFAINQLKSLKNRLNEEKKLYLTENIHVGDFTYGKPNVITFAGDVKLNIGKFCSIGPDVIILLGGEHNPNLISTYPFNFFIKEFSYLKGHPKIKGDINIGNDVWIGQGAVILSGVNIGDGAVIGANAIVTKDVPDYAIVVGNPAEVIRYRFDKETIKKLEKIKWWDFKEDKLVKLIPFLQNNDIEKFFEKIDNFD